MTAIALPNSPSFWGRLKGLWAVSQSVENLGDLPARVAKLEREVSVLQAQVTYSQEQFNSLVSPHAVLPTDVYIAGKRYTADGAAYITTTVSGTDGFSAGARITATGEQVVV